MKSLMLPIIARISVFFVLCSLILSLSGCNGISQELKSEIAQLQSSISINSDDSKNGVITVDPSLYYDYLLASGDGYNLVLKEVETVTESKVEVGVIDDDFNWIVPLSDNTIFNPDGAALYYTSVSVGEFGGTDTEIINVPDRRAYHYGGERTFFTENKYLDGDIILHIWNFEDDIAFDTGRIRCDSFSFNDGYAIAVDAEGMFPSGNAVIIDLHGPIRITDIYAGGETGRYIGIYAEGVFFAYDGFYDINGNRIIDLSEYAGQITNHPYFSDQTCELIAKNPNGIEFMAVIDIQGNFITDFTAID